MTNDKFDMEKDAILGIARDITWWEPNTRIYCKMVNTGKAPLMIPFRQRPGSIIAIDVHDAEHSNRLFDTGPLTSDRLIPFVSTDGPPPTLGGAFDQPDPADKVKATDANCGQMSKQENEEVMTLLNWFINERIFPTDPKKVTECLDGELVLPLIDGSHPPTAEKQR